MGRLSYSPIEVMTVPTTHQGRVLDVPVEIIDLIAEELLTMGCASELAALSLLGRRYVHTVQRRLFRHIDVSTYDRYAGLLKALHSDGDNLERCLALASMVRCLSITISPYPLQGEFPLYPGDIFNLCVNLPMLEFIDLKEVVIGGLGRNLVPLEEDLNLLATLNPIRTISLTGHPGHVGASMLVGLPQLEELRLFGDLPISLFSHGSPCSGRGLRRLTWGGDMRPTLRWIRWMFGESEQVIDGKLVLLVLPDTEAELDAVRQYALQCGIAFHAVGSVVVG